MKTRNEPFFAIPSLNCREAWNFLLAREHVYVEDARAEVSVCGAGDSTRSLTITLIDKPIKGKRFRQFRFEPCVVGARSALAHFLLAVDYDLSEMIRLVSSVVCANGSTATILDFTVTVKDIERRAIHSVGGTHFRDRCASNVTL